MCALFTIVIGWLYMLPQLQGSGFTVAAVTSLPSWTGAVAASAVVLATLLFGGMRSMTLVQAFQYCLKVTALVLPAVVLLVHFAGDKREFSRAAPPQFDGETIVDIRTDVVLEVSEPVTFVATGVVDGVPQAGQVSWGPGTHSVASGSSLTFAGGSAVPVPVGAPTRTTAGWRRSPASATISCWRPTR